MSKEVVTFGDIKVEKHKFHHRKNLILSKDEDCRCLIWFLQE